MVLALCQVDIKTTQPTWLCAFMSWPLVCLIFWCNWNILYSETLSYYLWDISYYHQPWSLFHTFETVLNSKGCYRLSLWSLVMVTPLFSKIPQCLLGLRALQPYGRTATAAMTPRPMLSSEAVSQSIPWRWWSTGRNVEVSSPHKAKWVQFDHQPRSLVLSSDLLWGLCSSWGSSTS